jgi:hypothetical protein
MGSCPGAERVSPTAKVIAEPKASPIIRVTTPCAPIDMLITGMPSLASARAVAIRRLSTSSRTRGITAILATSAICSSACSNRSTSSSRPGVASKS